MTFRQRKECAAALTHRNHRGLYAEGYTVVEHPFSLPPLTKVFIYETVINLLHIIILLNGVRLRQQVCLISNQEPIKNKNTFFLKTG